MRHAAALLYRDLCRRDLNALVDLDRITIDDFAVEVSGEFDSEFTLPGSCGANYGNNGSALRVWSAGILPAF
jgi:hypothetical protein